MNNNKNDREIRASVIIPNWNGKELLGDCLSSLNKQSFKDFEIILADNGSTDESVSFVTGKYPDVKILKLNKNFGFSKAVNEGVIASEARYVVFLNNDTSLDKNWLENLIKCADKHPEVISVNSKLLNFYNKKIIDGVGIMINEVGQAKSIGWQKEDIGQYNKEEYIFGATGGASLFKRDDFIKVGLFDENYFMYFEEVDFAFRAQFLGFKSIYCPYAIVYHKHKSTSKKLPQHIEYWQYRNMIQTVINNFPVSLLLKNFRWLKIILVYLNTIFYHIKNGFFWPPFLTQVWLVVNLPRLLKKRYGIQKNKLVSDEYIEGFLSKKEITFWGLSK